MCYRRNIETTNGEKPGRGDSKIKRKCFRKSFKKSFSDRSMNFEATTANAERSTGKKASRV